MCYGAEAAWVPYVAAAASAAVGGAGTYAAAKANKNQIESEYEAQRADKFRQAELQRQSDAAVRGEIAKFTPEQQTNDIAQATAARTAATAPPPAPPQASYQAGAVAAPVEVNTDLNRRVGTATTNAREEAAKRARLAAYGDVSMQQNMDIGRVGEALRQFTTQSRNQSAILPAEIRGSLDKSQGWMRRADIANTLGSIGSLYAMGMKKPAGIGYGAASNPSALGQTEGPY